MMTTLQLKAARALLDWTQQDLAKAAGVHLNVINNIERATTNPRQQTLEKLRRALEENGVAFIGTRGVELKREAVTVLKWEGEKFLATLVDDILRHVRGASDEVLTTMADIRNFDAHDAESGRRYVDEKTARGFRERLITRAMPGFYPRHSEQYRVLEGGSLGPVDTIVYGDRTAFIFWEQQETVVMKGAAMAETQRRIFENLWSQGHQPVRTARAAED